MNTDVMILREVVVKVTQLLAGMCLEVTQRGTQAKVMTCKRTHKPLRVNIPYLPDNASRELILAIQGFIDHEVAHILETDFSVHDRIDVEESKGRKGLRLMWNALEDTFIERRMAKRFAGSGFNLEQLHHFFLEEITKPALAKAMSESRWADAFAILLVPTFRAWSGQRIFADFFKATGFMEHPELAKAFNRLKPFAPELPKLGSTWDCFDLALKIDDALKAPAVAPPPPPPPMPAPPQPEPENEPQGENGGEGETPEDEGKGAGNEDAEPETDASEDDEPAGDAGGDEAASGDEQQEDETEDADAGGDAADGAEGPEEEDEGEGAEGGPGEADDELGGDPGAGEDGADDEEPEDDSGEPGDGAADDGDDAAEGEAPASEGDEAGAPDDAAGDEEDDRGDEDGEVNTAGAPGERDDESEEGDGESAAPEDADGSADGSPEPEDADGEAADGAGDPAGGATGGEEDEAGTEEALSEVPLEEQKGGRGNEDPNIGGPVAVMACSEADFEEAMAARIGREAKDATLASPYRIYTRDFDVIEPFPTNMEEYQDAWLTDLDERTRQSVGVMQRDIERMMQARSQVQKVPGFRSGRLHQAGLHKLVTGDDRVFRRLHVNKSKDVVVGLLIDNSGSMDGPKMRTAMQSGYALSSTLERVGIKHEVLGFTTKWAPWGAEVQEARKAAAEEGVPYTRYEPIYMPVFKSFDERLTSEVKRRFAAAPYQDYLGNNIDGESVERAAWRLLKRQEARKVLLVLSDGNPAADGDMRALRAHLKTTVEQVEKRGVEAIGIGIMDDAPRNFYKKFVLLQKADALPGAVMGELRKILLAA